MAVGRKLKIKKGGVTLLGIRSKTFTYNGEPIDLTDGEDDGFRVLDEETGERSIDISFDGVVKDSIFRDLALGQEASLFLDDITLEWPNGDVLTGNFYLSSFEETGAYKDALTMSGQLQSSGPWEFTKGA